MPSKRKLMNAEQKEFFMHHMLIPDGIVKCCPTYHKKITKKLDMLFTGELNEEMKLWQESATVIWTDEEVKMLRITVGIDDWNIVAEKMDADNHKFSAEQCRQQYEKIGYLEKSKQGNIESEEEEGIDDKREQQQTAPIVEWKDEPVEVEHDPNGESSATLSADEVTNDDESDALSPAVSTQQSSTQIYKPRFRGAAHLLPETTNISGACDSTYISSIIKREMRSGTSGFQRNQYISIRCVHLDRD